VVQKRVELTAVLFLAVILLAMPTTPYHATSVPLPENTPGAIAGFESIQLVPDPNLALPPNVTIEGSSGEFSVEHHISTGGMDFLDYSLERTS